MAQDWKQILGEAFDVATEHPAAAQSEEPQPAGIVEQQGNATLDIVLDRKGRKGKTATIICGFKGDDDALKDLAGELKRRCGTGGSSRGGEILLQGDWRQKVHEVLTQMGFKARII